MSTAKKPTARSKKSAMYLVVRKGYDAHDWRGIEYSVVRNEYSDDASEVPVRAFADKKAADAHARELDAEVRATLPPPLLADETDAEEGVLGRTVHKQVKALGLPEIKFGKQAYEHGRQFREWWAKHAADLTAEQKAALWEPFLNLRFHSVRKIDVEG